MQGIWMLAQFAIFILTVFLAISMAEDPDATSQGTADSSTEAAADDGDRARREEPAAFELDDSLREIPQDLRRPAFSHFHFGLFWTLSRVVYFILYICGCLFIKPARNFCAIYAGHFFVSVIFTMSITILSSENSGGKEGINRMVALGLAVAAIVFELFMCGSSYLFLFLFCFVKQPPSPPPRVQPVGLVSSRSVGLSVCLPVCLSLSLPLSLSLCWMFKRTHMSLVVRGCLLFVYYYAITRNT
jgi:hypothetical protein